MCASHFESRMKAPCGGVAGEKGTNIDIRKEASLKGTMKRLRYTLRAVEKYPRHKDDPWKIK
jgi:hypothetical protein